MAGLCKGGNEPSGSLKAIFAAPPARARKQTGHAGRVEVEVLLHSVWVVTAAEEQLGACETVSVTCMSTDEQRLFDDAISATRLFSVDGSGDSKVVFGGMRPKIRHRLPDIRLTIGKTTKKPKRIIRTSGDRTSAQAQLWVDRSHTRAELWREVTDQ
ncbi:hypothetical protein ANN_02841 [Periplaneta americana]|uniref:Uncharacterized protein n=1 Tax=Periplaneta americana TaxID=6978 RepID=A0ABQ8TXE4_PERAM|nr:hypothetical protein ANN_02841 [Periplaneta americana]